MTGMKLGSLFDGSGGFPLSGAIHGISAAWAAEIEPYPIRVTKARFPQMKHLGSVLDVNGAEVEPVDIITFGSPCQDLSVAGKQAGLHRGERSNLFFEAIRIIKEMRESTNGKYPRIAVWENVPGAYSSNKGEDFRAVLQAFCSVKDETADVPRPAAGKWNSAGAIVGNGWSIAWRTFDAQYWGVPQRRKRIYLIADFGSERAGEILFEQKGLRGHSEESGTAGQGAAGDAAGSAGRGVQCLNPWDCQSKRQYGIDGAYRTLDAGNSAGGQAHGVVYPIDLIRESRGAFETYDEDAQTAGSLKQCDNKGSRVVCYAVDGYNQSTSETAGTIRAGKSDQDHVGAICYPINTMVATRHKADDGRTTFGVGDNGDPQFTLGAAHEHAVCYAVDRYNQTIADTMQTVRPAVGGDNVGAVCYAVRTRNTMANGWGVSENAYTLDTSEGQAVAYSVDCRNMNLTKEHGTLQAKENGGQSLNYMGAVIERMRGFGDYVEDGTFSAIKARDYKDAVDLVRIKTPRRYIIRRLTPLETCRLQGFPDWWEDGVQGSDSARYKMWGNGIALPNAEYVIGCVKKLIGDAQ